MAIMCVQGAIVVVNAIISFLVMGVTWPVLKHKTKLAFCRLLCIKGCSSGSVDVSVSRSENPANDRSDTLHIYT